MTTTQVERPAILSTKDESDILLTPEEKAALQPPVEPEAVKKDAEIEQVKAEEKNPDELGQEDYNSLLEYAKVSGFKSVAGLIKSYESTRTGIDQTKQQNKELRDKVSSFEERIVNTPPTPQTVDPEKIKEAFYKSWEEDPVATLQQIYDYHSQTKILPAIQALHYEKELEVSRMAAKAAKKDFKLWGRVEGKVRDILEDDQRFKAMSGAAKTYEDKYEVLQLAYERALRIEGLEETSSTRVAVSREDAPPKIETGSDADAGTRAPKKKKTVNDEIADSIIAPTAFDDFKKRFF